MVPIPRIGIAFISIMLIGYLVATTVLGQILVKNSAVLAPDSTQLRPTQNTFIVIMSVTGGISILVILYVANRLRRMPSEIRSPTADRRYIPLSSR